jgi:RNA polymerase sigma-70 factor (ECF subfamily)
VSVAAASAPSPGRRRPTRRARARRWPPAAADLEEAARRAAGGDAEAFAAVCHATQQDVWRYCWSLTGDRHLADEAAQDAFARATTAIRRFRGDAPVRLWLLVLARRSVADLLRGQHRVPSPADPVPTAGADPSGVVDVIDLIECLGPRARQAFVLTQLVGFTYAEAAEVEGCAVGTIRSRVFRARQELVAAWAGGHPAPPGGAGGG